MRSGGSHYAERHAPSRACSRLSRLALGAAVLVWGVSGAVLWSAPDPEAFQHLVPATVGVGGTSVVVSLLVLRHVKLRVGRYVAWWLLVSGLYEMTAAVLSAVAQAWGVPASAAAP